MKTRKDLKSKEKVAVCTSVCYKLVFTHLQQIITHEHVKESVDTHTHTSSMFAPYIWLQVSVVGLIQLENLV